MRSFKDQYLNSIFVLDIFRKVFAFMSTESLNLLSVWLSNVYELFIIFSWLKRKIFKDLFEKGCFKGNFLTALYLTEV